MGFFYKDKPKAARVGAKGPSIASKSGPRRGSNRPYSADLAKAGCRACPNHRKPLQSPKLEPSGSDSPLVYVLGTSPGEAEDEAGEYFASNSGRWLRRQFPEDLEDSLRWGGVLKCHTGHNPTAFEKDCCRQYIVADIEASQPKLIIGLGHAALSWATGMTNTRAYRGRMMPVRIGRHDCWFLCVSDPADLLHNQEKKGGDEDLRFFKLDITRALAKLETLDWPELDFDFDQGVDLLDDFDLERVLAALKEASKWKRCGIDLETNGLRPFFKDSRILTVSISNGKKTYAFPLRHSQAKWSPKQLAEIDKALTSFLLDVGSNIAHNAKFEQEWLSEKYGDEVVYEGTWDDSMAQAYVLDEREGAKGLDDVTTLYLGFNIKKLSKVDTKKLDSTPLKTVLRYNALDAKYCYIAFLRQKAAIEAEGLEAVYERRNGRAGPIVIAQRRGVVPDSAQAAVFEKDYSARITDTIKKILTNSDVKEFSREHSFSVSSNPDLLAFFKEFLGCKETKVGENKYSTDESVLNQIDHPVAKLILEMRAASKMYSTYVLPYIPNGKVQGQESGHQLHGDGLIHTNFNHLLTNTNRLSSDDPNLQNFPKRKGKQLRKVIKAPDGYWMVSIDYGQIEARVIAMASNDKTFLDALWNNLDIHMDWAERLASAYPKRVGGKKFLADKDEMKKFRSDVKNLWTFPLFFGSTLSAVSRGLEIPQNVVTPLFDQFWVEFEGVHRWQDRLIKNYRKTGYVETLTGFRRRGPLNHNEIINSPIQGTAADIVTDGMVRLSHRSYEIDKPQLQFRINIHDDLTFYLPDETLEDDVGYIAKEMCMVPFDFVTCPITVEVSAGRNWGEQEDLMVFSSTDFGHKRRSK